MNQVKGYGKLSTKINVMISIIVLIIITTLIIISTIETQQTVSGFYKANSVSGTNLLATYLEGQEDPFSTDQTELLDSLKKAIGTEFTIFNGDVRAYTTIISNGERAVGTSLDQEIADIVIKQKKSYIGNVEILGVSHLCSYVPYKNANGEVIGVLFAGFPTNKLLPQLLTSVFLNIGIGIVLLIIILILTRIFIKRIIANRLEKVVAAAEFIAKGSFDFEIIDNQNDEITFLVDTFSDMKSKLRTINHDMMYILGNVAEGNWSVASNNPEVYVGEWKQLHHSISKMIISVNQALSQVAVASSQISMGSHQVSIGAQTLAQGSMEQSESIQQLSSKVTHIYQKVNMTASDSENATLATRKASEALAVSNQQMKAMMTAMDNINEKSNEIGKIIKTIDDIAFQTNILSLNAAVEAARAGSSGKGFAVVADEVRSLATKSAQAAQETTTLIEETRSVIESGNSIATETSKSIDTVMALTKEMNIFIESIAAASLEQANAINNVNTNTEQISSVVVTNTATAEESAAASEELSGQAAIMHDLISKFTLKQ